MVTFLKITIKVFSPFFDAHFLRRLFRSFIEDSQAGIKISPQDNNYMASTDRLVTLSGTIEEQMRATDLIVSKLSEDPHYTQSMNYPFSYPSRSLLRFSISLQYHTVPKRILNAHLHFVFHKMLFILFGALSFIFCIDAVALSWL